MQQIQEYLSNIFQLSGPLLPVTAVVALFIFLAKETLEERRRKKTKIRELIAIKRLIEVELDDAFVAYRNIFWTVRNIKGGLSENSDEDQVYHLGEATFAIVTDPTGNRHFRMTRDDEPPSGHFFPNISFKVLTDNLKEIAVKDKLLFEQSLVALKCLRDIKHIQDSIVRHLSPLDEDDDLPGFIDYAQRKLHECQKVLRNYYQQVTGREAKLLT